MLIGFKFGNFRSFKKIQEFSLIPGQVRTHNNHFIKINDKLNVLPFSCIYGPNASGKSTIILALDVVRGLLIHGGDSMVNNLYYRGDEEIKSSSYFEYELSINGKQYSYGFEFNFSSLSIESEWLIDFTNKERKIFERDVANGNFICGLKDKNETNRLRLYLEDNSKNNKRLFLGTFIKNLSYANISSVILEEMLSVYNELIFNMIIIKPSIQQIWNIDFEKNKDKILYYLQKADINIKDIIYERTSIEYLKNILSISAYEEIMDQYRLVSTKYANTKLTIRYANEIAIIDKDENGIYLKNLRFVHNNSNSTFGAYEESTGTLRILELLSILLTNDKIYIMFRNKGADKVVMAKGGPYYHGQDRDFQRAGFTSQGRYCGVRCHYPQGQLHHTPQR